MSGNGPDTIETGHGIILKVDVLRGLIPGATGGGKNDDEDDDAEGMSNRKNEEEDGPEELLTILPHYKSEPIQVSSANVVAIPRPPSKAMLQRILGAASTLLPIFKTLMTIGQDACQPLQQEGEQGKRSNGRNSSHSSLSTATKALEGSSLAVASLNELRTRAMKALATLYTHEEFIAVYLPLIREVSSHALATPPNIITEPVSKHRTLESKHPYENNTKQTFEVSFPGAVKLTIEFDAQSRTETGCDYLVFYKDRTRRKRWGMEKYSGR